MVQRALWVHGLPDLTSYVRAMADYSLVGRAEHISCPTLVTTAESGPLSAVAERLADALRGPRTLIRFTDAEGAGGHCESSNRSLFHQRMFDWLDRTLRVDV